MMEALSTASAAHLIHSLLFNNQLLPWPLQKQPPEAPRAGIAGQHLRCCLGSSLSCFPLHTQTCSRTLRNPSGAPQNLLPQSGRGGRGLQSGWRSTGTPRGCRGAHGTLPGEENGGCCLTGGHHGVCLTGGTLSGTLLTQIPPHGEPPKMGEDPSNTRGRCPTQWGEGTPNRGGTQHEGTPNTRDVRGPQTLGGTQQGCEGTPNTQGGGTTAEMCGDQGHEGAPNTEGGQR